MIWIAIAFVVGALTKQTGLAVGWDANFEGFVFHFVVIMILFSAYERWGTKGV